MSEFQVGDKVRVKNGVRLNGEPLENITAEVVRKANEYLFLKIDDLNRPGFRYVAHEKDCRKVYL